jgi:replicative DNA helicase
MTTRETETEKENRIKESERMVLGCMLSQSKSIKDALENLDVEDFFFDDHRRIFLEIKRQHEMGKEVKTDAVVEGMKISGDLEKIKDGIDYLALIALDGFSAHTEYYIEEMRKFSIERSTLEMLKRGISLSQSGCDPQHILETLRSTASEIQAKKSNSGTLYKHLLTPSSEESIANKIKATSPGANVGMRVGEIDLKIPGGALTIVAGPTGHGKTTAKINMVLNFLELNPGQSAYYFSYEESDAAIYSNFLNTYIAESVSQRNRESIKSYFREGKTQYISKDKEPLFIKKKDTFFKELVETGRLNVVYSDYSVEELVSAIRFLKKKRDVGLIAIDYMQLLRTVGKRSISRQEEMKEICLILKDCAVETGLPILISAQFNRQVVNEATLSPVMIGEAGDIERVANMIIGLWNRNYEGFTEEGNKGKNGKKIEKESAVYLEILKGRETGIGHSSVLDLNGNTGKLSYREKNHHEANPDQNKSKPFPNQQKKLWD